MCESKSLRFRRRSRKTEDREVVSCDQHATPQCSALRPWIYAAWAKRFETLGTEKTEPC